MSRVLPHIIEERAKMNVQKLFTSNYFLYRDFSGRDYGLDGIIEIFEGEEDNAVPSGKLVLIQIKGQQEIIQPLKNKSNLEKISSNIRLTTINYVHQDRLPVVLIINSIGVPSECYYRFLKSDIIQETSISNALRNGRDAATIHLSIHDKISDGNQESYARFMRQVNEYYIN